MTVDLERLKQAHPIAEVVSAAGVRLRATGRRFMGRCPFHPDDRPSLVIYPDTRSFHCFGCGAGGDVIDFVRRAHGLGFRDAVARLDATVPSVAAVPARGPRRPSPARPLTLDDRLVLTAACELYHEALWRSPQALAYLEGRGVPRWLVRRARLGYATGGELAAYLKRRRLSLRRARSLGLLHGGGGEALRGRLVVPDARGTYCAWMTGRALDERVAPRYLSLALPRPLLGLDALPGRRRLLVTEGSFDWLTLRAWGLPACALLGTQPGQGVMRLLMHFREVFLVLDGDAAGREASTALANALGARARVVVLPEGVKDVSELATRPEGRAAFFAALHEAEERSPDVASEP